MSNWAKWRYLCTTQPPLYDLISIQFSHGHNTRSSPYTTLIKPSSSLRVTHRSFQHASSRLWNQLSTSLRILHPNHSPPSQWPSFEHDSLTCYILLSASITFHCFTLSSKRTFSENLILHLSRFLSAELISLLCIYYRISLLIGFHVLVLFLSYFCYSPRLVD